MAIGVVKWFNATKGYGFIEAQGNGRDVFVHISAVEKAGINPQDMVTGQKVSFEIENRTDFNGKSRESAEKLELCS